MDPTQWDAPFPLIVTALFIIVLTRSNATYWAGRLVARGASRTRAARWMETAGYRRAIERLNRWGAPAVLQGIWAGTQFSQTISPQVRFHDISISQARPMLRGFRR